MAEATTKKEQSTDGYSKENKGEKEAKHSSTRAYYAGKQQDMTKKPQLGFLQVQEIFGTNFFFWMVFRRYKSDAVPRTGEDNCQRVQGVRARACPGSHTELSIPVKQYIFLFHVSLLFSWCVKRIKQQRQKGGSSISNRLFIPSSLWQAIQSPNH